MAYITLEKTPNSFILCHSPFLVPFHILYASHIFVVPFLSYTMQSIVHYAQYAVYAMPIGMFVRNAEAASTCEILGDLPDFRCENVSTVMNAFDSGSCSQQVVGMATAM